MFHLPTLLLVLIFGLLMNNPQLVARKRLADFLSLQNLSRDIRFLHLITAESAFLMRTFFFTLFGYAIDLRAVANGTVVLLGVFITAILLAARYLYLRFMARTPLFPEIFMTPKGLITILLFYSIPAQYLIPVYGSGIMFVVILLAGLLMAVGLLLNTDCREIRLEHPPFEETERLTIPAPVPAGNPSAHPEREIPERLPGEFPENWNQFVDRFEALERHLLDELELCLREVKAILDQQMEVLTDHASPREGGAPADYPSTREAAAANILFRPAEQFFHLQLDRRLRMAFELHRRSCLGLVSELPATVETDQLALRKAAAQSGIEPRGTRRTRKRMIRLRAMASSTMRSILRKDRKTEQDCLDTFDDLARQFVEPWEYVRGNLDRLRGERKVSGAPSFAQEAARVRHRIQDHLLAAASRLIRMQARQARRLRSVRNLPAAGPLRRRRLAAGVTWDIQAIEKERATVRRLPTPEDILRSEIRTTRTEAGVLGVLRTLVDGLKFEDTALRAEVSGIVRSLASFSPPGKPDVALKTIETAPPSARLEWLEQELANLAPGMTGLSRNRNRGKPGVDRTPTSQRKEAEQALLATFRRVCRPAITSTLNDSSEWFRATLLEIERAVEVVAYGVASGEDMNAEDGVSVTAEAVRNATTLLELRLADTPPWLATAEDHTDRAAATLFLEHRLVLQLRNLGFLSYLARQGVRVALSTSTRLAKDWGKLVLRSSVSSFEKGFQRFLVAIGWRAAPGGERLTVVVRPFLPKEFTEDLAAKSLPILYMRLFRPEPIQDPRFQVGRDAEMEVVADARALWESGRPVSLLLVGQRGSGKTSLINCLIKSVFSDIEIVRGEFRDRLTSEQSLREIVAGLVGTTPGTELEAHLLSAPRVVIIEELERAFLRQIGHFEAIRALQQLLSATCRRTLWVLAVNQSAFELLDASVALGQSFSHRINAGVADQSLLRQAILIRHHLSGFRLEIEPPDEQRGLFRRMHRRLMAEQDPEQIFFSNLWRASGGNFRTAFDIWLGQTGSFSDGILHMKPLRLPDLSPVIDVLSLEDIFSLQAVLQHGSLTVEEHARVFLQNRTQSLSQIDELLAREILEPEPTRPGYRVRPEAMRLVGEALYRRNLR